MATRGSQDEKCPPIVPSAHQGLLFSPGGLGGLLQGSSEAGGFRTCRECPSPTVQTRGHSSTKSPTTTQFPYNAALVTCTPFCECWVFLFA